MDKKHAIITDDPRLNYMVVPKPDDATGTVSEKETEGCGLAPNTAMIPMDKYDYYT
jgi:hypothetical protein